MIPHRIYAQGRAACTSCDLCKGDMSLALAACNAGPEAIYRFGERIPPFDEPRRYAPKVMQLYRKPSRRQM